MDSKTRNTLNEILESLNEIYEICEKYKIEKIEHPYDEILILGDIREVINKFPENERRDLYNKYLSNRGCY